MEEDVDAGRGTKVSIDDLASSRFLWVVLTRLTIEQRARATSDASDKAANKRKHKEVGKRSGADKRLAKQKPLVREEPSVLLDDVVEAYGGSKRGGGNGGEEEAKVKRLRARLTSLRARRVGGARTGAAKRKRGHHGVWRQVVRCVPLSKQAEAFLGELAIASHEDYGGLKDMVEAMAKAVGDEGRWTMLQVSDMEWLTVISWNKCGCVPDNWTR